MMEQIVIAALGGVLLTIVGGWFAIGGKLVTRDDVTKIVAELAVPARDSKAVCETHCPYIPDRQLIHASLERIERKLDSLTDQRGST